MDEQPHNEARDDPPIPYNNNTYNNDWLGKNSS